MKTIRQLAIERGVSHQRIHVLLMEPGRRERLFILPSAGKRAHAVIAPDDILDDYRPNPANLTAFSRRGQKKLKETTALDE